MPYVSNMQTQKKVTQNSWRISSSLILSREKTWISPMFVARKRFARRPPASPLISSVLLVYRDIVLLCLLNTVWKTRIKKHHLRDSFLLIAKLVDVLRTDHFTATPHTLETMTKHCKWMLLALRFLKKTNLITSDKS